MHIDSLQLYPIKSTAAVNVPNAVVEPRGLACDRRYMLVDDQGRFMTGRQHPDLVLVRAEITATGLRIEAPGMEPIGVIEPGSRAATVTVNIWRDETTARAVDPRVDRWFSDYLGSACRLVFQHAQRRTPGRARQRHDRRRPGQFCRRLPAAADRHRVTGRPQRPARVAGRNGSLSHQPGRRHDRAFRGRHMAPDSCR